MKVLKNHLIYSLALVWVVLAALVGMHWLPTLTIDGHTLRRVDLLSDIRPPEPALAEADTDSVALPPIVKPAFVDTCRTGLTCIEDYGDSTHRGMLPFYEALGRLDDPASADDLVRVAVFGDSFIEGDIFTADLREMLQQRYGGCGVGYVDMTSQTSGYRPTVRHTFGGWESHAATDSARFDRKKQGISSHYFVPRGGAYAEWRGQSRYASRLDTCQRVTLFFASRDTLSLTARVNGGEEQPFVVPPTADLQHLTLEGRIGSIRWTVRQAADSTLFYGVTMDGRRGIAVDNFSLRGSSGLTLRNIPSRFLRSFNRQRPYDLIVLVFGLNVATERGRDYNGYRQGMEAVVAHLQENFPQAGFLLVGVGDRDYKTDEGDFHTMPGVKNLIRYQQAIAAQSGIAFWNMFDAMGGEESMSKLVHAKPQMANYDYTHINFRGGKRLAGLLFDTMMYGKEQYDRRRAYEEE